MSEQTSMSANLEAELAELSKQIEVKRAQLEASRGIVVEHKDAVRELISKEIFGDNPPAGSSNTQQTNDDDKQKTDTSKKQGSGGSYLDRLDPQSIAVINELIQAVPKDGVKKTITRAKSLTPYLLDAFHDALVDKLYDELKKNNLIK